MRLEGQAGRQQRWRASCGEAEDLWRRTAFVSCVSCSSCFWLASCFGSVWGFEVGREQPTLGPG